MSIIDELLVLLDDQEEMSLDNIKKKFPKRSKQTISSTLGRLCSKGWLKSRVNDTEKQFKITSGGREEITSNLGRIKEMEKSKWDESWLMAVFNIPEKNRKARDLFRKELTQLGFARIQGDIWVSFWNNEEKLNKKIGDLKIERYCTILHVDKFSQKDQKKIMQVLSWNEEELNVGYQDFIKEAKHFVAGNKDGFKARCLVYTYSKLISIDPKFPEELEPELYIGKKAYQLYLKVRPYCYK